MASRTGTLRALALLAVAAATACSTATAWAHGGSGVSDRAAERVAGPRTTETRAGLLRVRPAVGRPLLSHGPDPAPVAAAGTLRTTSFEPGSPERAPLCADDYYQRVLYGHLAGTPDRAAEVAEDIRSSLRRMDAVLNEESLASGGPTADYKTLCDASGAIAVDSFEASGASFAEVVSGARAAGFRSSVADFLIYFDGEAGGSCGIASYNSDESLAMSNASNTGGGYGIVYQPCWSGETPMHESGHLMGAVQYGAPQSTGSGGHCWEENDVMCYAPDGGDLHQGGTVTRCAGVARFDCNFDDYFDSAPEPGEYLASHWNLGSPLNRFLSFDGATGTAPGPGANQRPSLGTGGKKRAAVGAAGDWRFFKFRARRHSRLLRVRVFAAPGADVALFLRSSKKPTREVYKCRDLLDNRHASCRIRLPKAGRWYAGVLNRGTPVGTGYRISVRNKSQRD